MAVATAFAVNRRRWLCRVSTALVLVVIGSAAAAQDGLAAIADGFVREAQALLRRGELVDQAVDLLQRALDHDPGNSDALALLGNRLAQDQKTVLRGIELLVAARSYRRFSLIDPDDVLSRLAQALVRIGRADDAVSLLVVDRRIDQLAADPDLYYWYLVARHARGSDAGVRALSREAVRRYPDDPRFRELVWRFDAVGVADFVWIERNRATDPAFLAAYLAFITAQPHADMVSEWVSDYYSLGGTDPSAAVLAFVATEAGETTVREALLDRFFARFGHHHSDLLAQIARFATPAEQTMVAARLDGFTGTMSTDANRDGFVETEYRYLAATIVQYQRDTNQNGIADVVVEFADGRPAAIGWFDATIRYLRYDPYPEVAEVWFAAPNGFRRFLFDVPAATFQILDPVATAASPLHAVGLEPAEFAPALAAVDGPQRWTLDWAQSQAYQRWDYDIDLTPQTPPLVLAGVPPVSRTALIAGRPVAAYRDSNRSGRVDTVVFFRDGREEYRFRDLLEDGRFSLVEIVTEQGPLRIELSPESADGYAGVEALRSQFYQVAGLPRTLDLDKLIADRRSVLAATGDDWAGRLGSVR